MFKAIRYCWLMYLRTLELDPARFLSAPALAWQAALKKTFDILTDIEVSLMVEKGIRGGTCQAVH